MGKRKKHIKHYPFWFFDITSVLPPTESSWGSSMQRSHRCKDAQWPSPGPGSRAPQACITEIKRIPWLFQLLHTQSILVESAVACIVRALGARRCCPGGGERALGRQRPGLQRWARGGRGCRQTEAAPAGAARRGAGGAGAAVSAAANQRSAPGAACALGDAGGRLNVGAQARSPRGVLPWRQSWTGRGRFWRRGKGPRVRLSAED